MVLSLSKTFLAEVYQVTMFIQGLDLGFMKILHIFYNLMLNRPFDAMFLVYISCMLKCSSPKGYFRCLDTWMSSFSPVKSDR